jgi:VWFA-related protein
MPQESSTDPTAQRSSPEAKFKIRSLLVNEPVTVRDSDGKMVHNLEPGNFLITDNGIKQQITHFELGGDAISLVVAVETSSRVEPILPEIRRSGILLSQTVMGPNGEEAVLGFNDSVEKLQNFTSNSEEVDKVISGLRSGTSGSKLYDAMALGVEMLSARPEASATGPGRRRVLLVMAESDDIGSATKLGAVLRQAQLQNVTIYGVGLSSTRSEFQRWARQKRGVDPEWGKNNWIPLAVWAVTHIKDQVSGSGLQIAAAATGGSHNSTWKDRSLQTAIDEIGGELHSQYILTYTPTGSDAAGYHEIKVELDMSGLKVKSRPGYYLTEP